MTEFGKTGLEELVALARTTNRILTLALADSIERNVRKAVSGRYPEAILSLLLDGEVTSDAMQRGAKTRGIARATLYRHLAQLEQAGIVERPRRGVLAMSAVALPYLGHLRGASHPQEDGAPEELQGE